MNVLVQTPWLVSRKRSKPVTTIVLHATQGASAASSIEFLRQPKADSPQGYGYHAIIERNGDIYKCVPLSMNTLHAGRSKGPDGSGVNGYSIGVCFANMQNGEPYTEKAIEAAVWFVKEVMKEYPSIKWITTHYFISPGRKTDPKDFAIVHFAEKVGLMLWKP